MRKYPDEVTRRTAAALSNARSLARKRRFAQAEQLAAAQPTPEILELVETYKEFTLAQAEYERQLDRALHQHNILRPTWPPSIAQEHSRSAAATRMRSLRRRKKGLNAEHVVHQAEQELGSVQAPLVDTCTNRTEVAIEDFRPGDEVDADGRIWRAV